MNKDVKRAISAVVDFNVDNDYYDEDKKKEVLANVKIIFNTDDDIIKKYIKNFLSDMKKLADKNDLLNTVSDDQETPSEETPTEEPSEEEPAAEQPVDEPTEEPEEDSTDEDEKKEENMKNEAICGWLNKNANKYLY